MSSKAFSGVGTTFSRWDPEADSSQGAWEELAEVNNISGPGMSRETIDVTTLNSTGGYREIIAGLRDGGQVSMSMNFTREEYEKLKEDFESDDKQHYQIMLPDPEQTAFEFEGLVMEIPLDITVDDKVTVDVTIQISGQVNLSSGGEYEGS